VCKMSQAPFSLMLSPGVGLARARFGSTYRSISSFSPNVVGEVAAWKLINNPNINRHDGVWIFFCCLFGSVSWPRVESTKFAAHPVDHRSDERAVPPAFRVGALGVVSQAREQIMGARTNGILFRIQVPQPRISKLANPRCKVAPTGV
jgi:hypothetical protein